MFKQFIAAAIVVVLAGTMVAEEVTFEIVGTFDRVFTDFTDVFEEGDGYTLSVRYDDEITGTMTETEFSTQTEYRAILDATLTTSGGLETSITTGANSTVTLNEQLTGDVIFFTVSDFDLVLDSNVPEVELGPFELAMYFLMPPDSLDSQELTDFASIASDVLLSAPLDNFTTLTFGDGGPVLITSSIGSIKSVQFVPEPATDCSAFVAFCAVVLLLRRRQR